MIKSKDFLNLLKKNEINFFCGVPDTILKNFLSYLDSDIKIKNITAVNEGSAVSLAIGNFLASNKPSLVYMQNSGLGNAINPLISIAEKTVYSIPVILLIGWRGAPGISDEPQHNSKGKITLNLLKQLNIKNVVIKSKKDFKKVIKLIDYSKKNNVVVAILIKKNSFYLEKKFKIFNYQKAIIRFDFLKKLLSMISKSDKVISTTGFTSRELDEIRKETRFSKGKDFYMIGGMGHSSSVALGYSLSCKSKVICLDGDGSMLMHMGSLSTITNYANKNYKYILLNNNTHESVGGQKTNVQGINIKKLSQSLKFKNFYNIQSLNNINRKLETFLNSDGPSFLNVKIKSQSLKNLKRPKNFIKIKKEFMSF